LSGLYALWTVNEIHRGRWLCRRLARTCLVLGAAWGLGFLLAAPYVLPVLEYTHTGRRLAQRGAGAEERPPVGLRALPQVVLPYMYGSRETGSLRLEEGNEMESSAAAYAGLVATLLVAPLAWTSRRHRSINLFLGLVSFLSLAWCLNVPGYVDLLRLPGLNMMSHNRFVFAASFAILSMMAIGLEVLLQGPISWRWWLWVSGGLLAGLFGWCLYRSVIPPEPVATQLEEAVHKGYHVKWIHTAADVLRLQGWFERYYAAGTVLCCLGLAGWILLRCGYGRPSRLLPIIGAMVCGDLLWFGVGRSAQCDPALYFPPIPALDEVAKSVPGRIIGADCLPAMLASMRGLKDIRGYDGVDPARLIDLAAIFGDPQSKAYPYGLMRRLTPKVSLEADGEIRFSPVLDMLGVRYLVGRGSPPAGMHPAFQSTDYWVVVNSNALPRVFVPERVERAGEDKEQLQRLAAPEFNPRAVAYVESTVDLPASCRGSARIVRENPTHITVTLRMETRALVVLADLWDRGWRAYLNGAPAPILRTNHALRGVVVPAGAGTLEFCYEPGSFKWGLRLAGVAAVLLACWFVLRRAPRLSSGE